MKMKFNEYVKLIFMPVIWIVPQVVVIVSSIVFHPALLLFLLMTICIAMMPQISDWDFAGQYVPTYFHMMENHEYIIDDSYVYVKMPIGVWVWTGYRVASMEEFIEKKIDYQHKQKETFKV